MTGDAQTHPWDRLTEACAKRLAAACPRKHNELLGGLHDQTLHTLAGEALMVTGFGGFSTHRLPDEDQERHFGSFENEITAELSPELISFYVAKLDEPLRATPWS